MPNLIPVGGVGAAPTSLCNAISVQWPPLQLMILSSKPMARQIIAVRVSRYGAEQGHSSWRGGRFVELYSALQEAGASVAWEPMETRGVIQLRLHHQLQAGATESAMQR